VFKRILFLLFLVAGNAYSAESTLMLRYPDLYASQVVFSYAGDLWLADIDDSLPARRLTSHPGLELYPKFSPDGQWIAFTGQYRGDEQVYVISVNGGEPKQLSYYPTQGPLPSRWGTDHQVYGWSPDGKRVLFRSLRQDFGNGRLYQVSVDGGLPSVLPMPRAGSGDFSPDGNKIAYSPLFRDFRTWKRYQGGWAQNLYIYDLENNTAKQITDHVRTERDAVWLKNGIYFVSDRDGTLELFSYDLASGEKRQLTEHSDWDIKWASGDGASRIVYEIGGQIGLFDTNNGLERRLEIQVPDDQVRRTDRRIDVSSQIEDFGLSGDGKRALITARGDVFTVPIEHGVTRNLTRRAGSHEREASWSPDGSQVAFISDRSGEEQIYVVPQEGGEARVLTQAREARLYRPVWAPDGQSIAYYDHRGVIHVTDLTGNDTVVFESRYGVVTDYVWAPDSKWIAFSRRTDAGFSAVYIWSRKDQQVRMATDGIFNAFAPGFGHDGKHLYFVSDRQFAPQIGSFEWNYVADRESGIYALALNADSGNPFAPRNDEVGLASNDNDKDAKDKKDEEDQKKDAGKSDKKDQAPEVKIDFDGLAERLIRVPVEADNISSLSPLEDHLLYRTSGPIYYDRESDVPAKINALEFKERKSEVIAEDFQGVAIADNGKYILVQKKDGLHRIELAKPKEPVKVGTGNLIVYRAPAEEWPEIFDEVWRRFRDYFYVSNMHGLDWVALRDRYRPLVADVSTREDLNTLIGEMIAELNVGHAYVAGGDLQAPKRSGAALLGARFELDAASGKYRVAYIYPGQNAEPKYRSPLLEVGVDIKPGDYVLAIDGQTLSADRNPYDLLTDRGQQPVELTVNSKAELKGSRRVLVDPISSETSLVYLDWVERNRQYVLEQTDGKVGYLHIPDMGPNGIYEFIKWYYPQIRKAGLVVDVRSNGGGNVSQMILRRLMQKPLGFGYQAHSEWVDTYPQAAFNGSMVALLNEDSASDGDIFPYYFRKAGLGPLIGKRSWGGVVGITGHGPVIDGGQVFVPEFGIGDATDGWVVEGHGVDPDIEVTNDPASKRDAQLDRGIAEVLKRMTDAPQVFPPKPASPVKTD
jgi:tricorn protease